MLEGTDKAKVDAMLTKDKKYGAKAGACPSKYSTESPDKKTWDDFTITRWTKPKTAAEVEEDVPFDLWGIIHMDNSYKYYHLIHGNSCV